MPESRYSKQELGKLNKAQLLGLIRRQPNIVFPSRVGSGPVESLTVRQLRTALAGPYGYVKAAVAPFEESATVVPGIVHTQLEGSRQSEADIPNDTQDSRHIASDGGGISPSVSSPPSPTSVKPIEMLLEPDLAKLATSVEAVSLQNIPELANPPSPSNSVHVIADVGHGVLIPPVIVRKFEVLDQDVTMDDDTNASNFKLADALNAEQFSMTFGHSQSWASAESTSSSSSLKKDNASVFESYPDNTKPDDTLLDEFFEGNPRLAGQLATSKAHRRKRQSDANLVRDYKFNIALYKKLLDRRWENDTGRILGDTILKYLGISSPWLAKARKVVELFERLGPDSLHPDPLVVERFSSAAITNKGDDILKFLKARHALAQDVVDGGSH